jgi:hypothetical protein
MSYWQLAVKVELRPVAFEKTQLCADCVYPKRACTQSLETGKRKLRSKGGSTRPAIAAMSSLRRPAVLI